MKYHRAEQIVNAPTKIDVVYEGESVWISELNPKDETAVIKIKEDNNERRSLVVPVEQLVEQRH